jgi:predicted metal-dependent hydrolase
VNNIPTILLVDLADDVARIVSASVQAHSWRVHIGIDPEYDALPQIADLQPALIVVMAESLPDWMATIRSNTATRRIPVLAISSSADSDQTAHHVGIRDTLRPADLADPAILFKYARPIPHANKVADSCAGSLSSLVLKGLHEFNTHEFFECHETLEAAWNAETGPVRELYRVILQVGLAYYQIERGNYVGALKMFLRTRQWFAALPDRCRGIDVAQLRADAEAARIHLEVLGPERIDQFDRGLIKPIQYEVAQDTEN